MAAVTYGGSGQVMPGGRRSGYNRKYWAATEKDIRAQAAKLRYPNRASVTLPKLGKVSPGTVPTHAIRGKSTTKTFAGKRGHVQR